MMSASLSVREAVAPAERTGPGQLEDLLGVGVTLDFAAGQSIALEGDPRTYGYRVLAGAVRLFKTLQDGRRQVVAFPLAGQFFGLLEGPVYACSAEAIVSTTLARYPHAGLEAALRSGPELAFRLLDAARSELERTRAHMLLLGRQTAEEKVAAFLLSFALQRGVPRDQAITVRLPMTRQDLADHLGLTIETVSRTMTRLRQRGLIAFTSPQDIMLARVADLAALAGGSCDH